MQTVDLSDPADVLADSSIFEGLTHAELAAVAGIAEVHYFPPRSVMFAELQPCAGLWVLAAGLVKLHHSSPEGREHIVAFASPPAPLVLWAVLDGLPHTETATTFGPVTALFLPRQAFLELLRHRPVITGAVIQQLCRELRVRDIAGGVGALKDASARLACRLVQLAREYGIPTPAGICINIRLTRRDLAASIGVTLETAIRALSRWQREGLLSTREQVIEIHDFAALQQIAGCDRCQFDCSVFGPPPRGVD